MRAACLFMALLLITGCATNQPCVNGGSSKPDAAATGTKQPKKLWATSYLWAEAPELQVEKWLTDKPETKGKYVLIEFWNTWCPPCRKSIPILNEFHKKYGDELVIIGLCDETEEEIKALKGTKIDFFSAMDTQARMKKEMNVLGVPHAIIIEPENGCVIWEGFPLLKDHELTEDIIEKILAIGRKIKAEKKAQPAKTE